MTLKVASSSAVTPSRAKRLSSRNVDATPWSRSSGAKVPESMRGRDLRARNPNGATHVVNKQTGQWGTQYDPAQDLVRVPMRVSPTPAPVERLTIDAPITSAGPVLRIAWDTREMTVPVAERGR